MVPLTQYCFILLTTVGAGLGLGLLVGRLLADQPLDLQRVVHSPPGLLAVVVPLALAAVTIGYISKQDYYSPWVVRFYEAELIWVVVKAVILYFLALTIQIYFSRGRAKAPLLALGGLLCLAVLLMEAWATSSVSGILGHRVNRQGIVLQTSRFSCAPAALATALRFMGREATEQEVARRMGTSYMGTSGARIVYAARSYGLEVEEVGLSFVDLLQLDHPALLEISLSGTNHIVVALGGRGDRVLLGDPMRGLMELDHQSMRKIWKNYAIILTPPDSWRVPSLRLQRLKGSPHGWILNWMIPPGGPADRRLPPPLSPLYRPSVTIPAP